MRIPGNAKANLNVLKQLASLDQFTSLHIMGSYAQTVQLFSQSCFTQLNQTLSTLDSINIGFGVTLVPVPRHYDLFDLCLRRVLF